MIRPVLKLLYVCLVGILPCDLEAEEAFHFWGSNFKTS